MHRQCNFQPKPARRRLAVVSRFLLLSAGVVSLGPDVGWVTSASTLAVFVVLLGLCLRNLHSYYQELEGSHYVRYGD